MNHQSTKQRLQRFIFQFSSLIIISHLAYAGTGPSKSFVQWLHREMDRNQVPGVSIAVIRDYKVEWALGFGQANIRTEEAVTDETLFQAGSISKPVTAMAVLEAVQDGKLTLDGDINQYLTSWHIPFNEYTVENQPTVAMLLSHSAGINVPSFVGYAQNEKIPKLLDVLNGKTPANSEPIKVISTPDQQFMYSGGGYTILQQALVDVYHKPFPQVMDTLVLSPLGMTHSTFMQPLPKSDETIATPYRPGYVSVPGGPHTYPELAAAGLWTTPFDLAKFVISIQESLRGDPNQILDRDDARLMVRKKINHMGLGFFVNMNKYGEPTANGDFFLHEGLNEGYRSILIASTYGGYGAIIMTNMTPDSQLVLNNKIKDNWSFVYAIVKKIADTEGW